MIKISEVENLEQAVLVGIITHSQTEKEIYAFLNELAFLAETAGVNPVRNFTQRLDHPNPRSFVGAGKLNEIKEYITLHEIKLVIFDDELSPSQLRNIEKELACKILDRTNLILDIFAQRAKTAYAKTQVELAQYEYLLPRLTGLWTHLERQRGGIGMRGPGETEIETDRRIIRDKISKLKEDLSKIDKQMATQRKNRGQLVRVALVGYTNAGKSTLMNLLSKSEVLAENKLFATLDTTVRKVVISNLPFLLSDTVGFIRKLPHNLVESFKSTLDEVREADILLHIVDISHDKFQDQIEVVNNTLKEIGASEVNTVVVFNKIDNYYAVPENAIDIFEKSKTSLSIEELENSWMAKENAPCFFISATKKLNFDNFKQFLYQNIKDIHAKKYPYNNFLYEVEN